MGSRSLIKAELSWKLLCQAQTFPSEVSFSQIDNFIITPMWEQEDTLFGCLWKLRYQMPAYCSALYKNESFEFDIKNVNFIPIETFFLFFFSSFHLAHCSGACHACLYSIFSSLMDNSHQFTQERADIEWKFARSKLWIRWVCTLWQRDDCSHHLHANCKCFDGP